MPLPPATSAAAASGGANVLSNVINGLFTAKQNKKQREWNEKMYEREKADNLAFWNMQNEYNTPAMQMQRLKDAKLNPNLVYGNGADATAGPIQGAEVKSWNPQAPQVDLSGVGSSLAMMYDLEIKQAQADNIKQMTRVAAQEELVKSFQQGEIMSRTAKTDADRRAVDQQYRYQTELMPLSLQAAEQSLKKAQADTQFTLNQDARAATMNAKSVEEATQRILSMQKQMGKTDKEMQEIQKRMDVMDIEKQAKEWDLKMRRMGYNPNDPAWQRMLQMGIQKIWDQIMGSEPGQNFERGSIR